MSKTPKVGDYRIAIETIFDEEGQKAKKVYYIERYSVVSRIDPTLIWEPQALYKGKLVGYTLEFPRTLFASKEVAQEAIKASETETEYEYV
jgi:uncharacterized protein YhbP (UPF0306 family)